MRCARLVLTQSFLQAIRSTLGSCAAYTSSASATGGARHQLNPTPQPRGLCSAAGTDAVDAVVIGAGVVGLACARELALRGQEVVLLEAAAGFGTDTSSRNSEVIHAGIYYPPGSLKARLCIEGKRLLYDYCQRKDVPHKRLGKLLVATSKQQIGRLEPLLMSCRANGVEMHMLSGAEARQLEPELACEAALLSPSTGILDSHSYMEALLGDAEAAGAVLAVHSRVVAGCVAGPVKELRVRDDATRTETTLHARAVVNAAGLHAQSVSSVLQGLPPATIPRRYLAKGSYFSLAAARPPFSRLVYPLPQDGGLGVHFTLDMGCGAKFGPDAEWVDSIDYQVDPRRGEGFYAAVRTYYPGLPEGALQPAYSGIRSKLAGPGQPAADFAVHGKRLHGLQGVVALYGVESPGLTASLALAEHVADQLLREH